MSTIKRKTSILYSFLFFSSFIWKIVWNASLLRCFQSVNRLFINVFFPSQLEQCGCQPTNISATQNLKRKHKYWTNTSARYGRAMPWGHGILHFNHKHNIICEFEPKSESFHSVHILTLIRILRREASKRSIHTRTERQWKMSKKYN